MKKDRVGSAIFLMVTFLLMSLLVPDVKAQSSYDESDVNWISYSKAAEEAKTTDKKLMLFLEADWCGICKRMHREVFTNDEVASLISSDFYPVRIDIESDDMIPVKGEMISQKEYSKSVGIYGTPTILFLDSNEEIVGNFVGYSDESEMARLLNFIASGAYMNETLESYTNKGN